MGCGVEKLEVKIDQVGNRRRVNLPEVIVSGIKEQIRKNGGTPGAWIRHVAMTNEQTLLHHTRMMTDILDHRSTTLTTKVEALIEECTDEELESVLFFNANTFKERYRERVNKKFEKTTLEINTMVESSSEEKEEMDLEEENVDEKQNEYETDEGEEWIPPK